MMHRQWWSCVLVAAAVARASLPAGAQVVAADRPAMRLTDYEGVYAYHGTATIAIVAADSMLFAVLDEAKYPLRPLGEDRVLNAGGDTIPFRRGADGSVSGFVERGTYAVRSRSIARSPRRFERRRVRMHGMRMPRHATGATGSRWAASRPSDSIPPSRLGS